MSTGLLASFAEPGMAAFRRGLTAQRAGEVGRAIDEYRTALRQHPGLAPAHFNLGQLLRERGDYAEAAVCFEGAARLRPTATDAWLNLGAMLERLERYHDAVAAYRRAIASSADDATPHYNLGNALLALGDFQSAVEAFRAVLERAPTHPDANWNLATALLGMADFRSGWEQYEWRWSKERLDPSTRFAWPLWAGELLAERRIVVWREQGLGDELMFATCVRELVAAGAEVTLLATDRLIGLFSRAFPSVRVVSADHELEGHYDYHAPLGSLPRFVRPSRESFPPQGKYLVPDSRAADRWTARLDNLGEGPKVGICWRSGLLTDERRKGYSTLDEWGALFALPGVTWINLQYDDCRAELEAAERQFGVKIHRWRSEDLKNNLESVVGLMWHLDAVVTAPTVVGSLSGALGVPTWELDTGSGWTAHGEAKSPWFPTTRVVRRGPGTVAWAAVLERIAGDLRSLLPRPAAL